MDSIFAEDGQIENRHSDKAEITSDGHTPIPPASYEENEEWAEQYQEQFGTEPSFF